MPLYKYKCKNCGNIIEKVEKIKDRYLPTKNPCQKCSGEYKILIGNFNRGFVLEPQYFEHLDTNPVWIENKNHLKRECEKRNVEAKCLYD